MRGLAVTLRHAGQSSPFYERLLAGRKIGDDNVMDALTGLPVWSPADWSVHRDEIRTGPVVGAAIGFTSGSVRQSRPVLSTQAERDAVAAAIRAAPHTRSRILGLTALNHGVELDDQGPNVVMVPFIRPEHHFDNAVRILERRDAPYTGLPPFDIVSGSLRLVKQLTVLLLHRRGRVDDLGIRRLVVTSQMLSPGWRERLCRWWNADIETVYGFSELRMCNARWCGRCDHYHLPPSCFGEVLDPDNTSASVAMGGRGLLAVTAFYPFVQLEPRIRYRPGDLVELASHPCPQWGEPGFRPLGREEHAVRMTDGTWLTSADCFAALADLPDVATFDQIALATGDPRFHECGSPRFAVTAGDSGDPAMHIELRYDPDVWSEQSAAVRTRVRHDLGQPALTVLTHGPGALPGRPYYV